MRRSLDPDRLAARSPAAAAAPALPHALVDARAAFPGLALPLTVAALTVGAAAPGAVSHALYADEVASARIVTEPAPRNVLRHVRRTESTPPAWYLVAWGARKATAADVASLSPSPVRCSRERSWSGGRGRKRAWSPRSA